MANFRYKSVTGEGEVVEGRLEASDQGAAVARLHQMGHLPVRVEAAGGGRLLEALNRDILPARPAEGAELVTLTRKLATLLRAELPLDRALELLSGLTERKATKAMVERLLAALRGGSSLADALDKEGKTFPTYYRAMVRAGEIGASLDTVLERLADFLERAQETKGKLRSALIYPIFLLVTAGASLAILLTFVIPAFQPMFEDAGTELPLVTQIVIGFGAVVRQAWWIILLALAVAVVSLQAHLGTPAGRLWWHRQVLRLPVIGALWVKNDVARFARTLATLLANGVPLLNALELVREVMSNAALSAGVTAVQPDVKAGRGLAAPLSENPLFPPLLVQLLRVGEESGRLEDMLAKLAEIYDQESEETMRRLLALLVPVLTLGLGALIAFIVSSILFALFSVNELVL
ncbi:type II secretion system F family protein [Pelagibius sp. CAU 1746]|uniref:type II secretion system F family protein n=1 Tax=Pelagibius sp. CAU 1746 TaxID=3140370 RepID=UPI00325B1B07